MFNEPNDDRDECANGPNDDCDECAENGGRMSIDGVSECNETAGES